MNRLVLIGNGFDLAHGLRTRYQDFIDWYWEQRYAGLKNCYERVSDDGLCSLSVTIDNYTWHSLLYGARLMSESGEAVGKYVLGNSQYCKLKKFSLLNAIYYSLKTKEWIDIENDYYELLKSCILIDGITPEGKVKNVQSLNIQLSILQQKLTEYLSTLPIGEEIINPVIRKNLYAPILPNEISVEWKSGFDEYIQSQLAQGNFFDLNNKIYQYNIPEETIQNFKEGIKAFRTNAMAEYGARMGEEEKNLLNLPDQILFLSFNYTPTIDLYCKRNSQYFTLNHIHGTLDAPETIIFGYGDELDEKYKEIRDKNENRFLTNIKSIRYLESDNYRKMLQFIDSAPFQIFIMGHSCGNSDRTLLNTLFEHRNCVSIKPFYHTETKKDNNGDEYVKDDYLELVQNISRNFTDMKLMRDRVVNKTYCTTIDNNPGGE